MRPGCRHIVLHYHEIALKGRNRPRFIATLTSNVRHALRDLPVAEVRALQGRILVTLGDDGTGSDLSGSPAALPAAIERLRRVFGIVSLSPTYRTAPTIEALESAVPPAVLASGRRFESFAIATRRAEKGFPFTSPIVNARVGAVVQAATGARVNLGAPDLTVRIELLAEGAFFHVDKIAGPGGLPVGSSGRVVVLLSGGIDSPVAAYRIMKRGCPAVLVHFHSEPYLNRSARDKAVELAGLLAASQRATELHLVPLGEFQKEVSLVARADYRVVLYRRMMLRLAARIASARGALALATGESIGQVASQTVENMTVIGAAVTLPIFRPLIGFDKDEIIREARAIGSYETSILPDQDCCQLFVPAHPVTRARPRAVEIEESKLDLDAFMTRALAATEMRVWDGREAEVAAPLGGR